MMNNKWFKTIAVSLICISVTFLVPRAIGQTIENKIPDLKIDGAFINGDQKSSLPDLYKKGGLIINFWATWCAPCIKEQKVLDSLMQIYPELSVLSTTYQDSVLVRKHFEKVGLPKSRSMIITANDKVLHNLFKHRSLPHNIWIDKTGTIKTITGGDEINEKNVKDFLKGNSPKLDLKMTI
ncbi:TlpA family protein disulfide reductase [Pedobacter sp. NJ-S-72]